jgi:hypothetical protein
MRGIISIIIGVIFVVGGLSGKLAPRGMQSGRQLAVFGSIFIVIGIIRLARG